MTIHGSKRTNDITSLHSQYHHSLTDRRTMTSRLNWLIRSIQRELNTINWRETTHFDSEDVYRTGTLLKRQSLSTTTVLPVLENLRCLKKTYLTYYAQKSISIAPTLGCSPQYFLARRERRTRIVDSINIMASHVQPYQIKDTSVNI